MWDFVLLQNFMYQITAQTRPLDERLLLQKGKQLGLQGVELEEGLQLLRRHVRAEQGALLVHVRDQLSASRCIGALILLWCDVANPKIL